MSGSLGIELSVAQSDLVQALSVLLLGKKLHSRSFFLRKELYKDSGPSSTKR